MKKTNLIILGLIALLFVIFIIKRLNYKQSSSNKYQIGILQTASHPALDNVLKGFTTELKNKLGYDVSFVIQNAQGSVAAAHTIAQQFKANSQFKAFLTIATPAAQALHSVEKTRPIIIAAVTDPNALGLIYANTNICGTKDMINTQKTVNLITELVPNTKTVGLVYTAGELNSEILAKTMDQYLKNKNLTVSHFAAASETDLPAIVELACRKSDLILTPTDNNVAIAIDMIAATCLKHQKPLIVSDNTLVKSGALAACGVNYEDCGRQAADIAYEVLINDQKPADMPIKQANCDQIFINQDTLNKLGLTLPEKLQASAILVS